MRIDSPMSITYTWPLSASAAACNTRRAASGMVMKKRVTSGCVTVTGPPRAICSLNFGITLPLIRPVIALVLVVSFIGSFQVFDLVQVGYGNNPIPEVRVIYYYIYQLAFSFHRMGYASAVSILLVVLLGALTYVQLRMMRANRSDLA